MKRFLFAVLVACGNGADETTLDAAIDQTTSDAANDVAQKKDATTDAGVDAQDATTDVLDASSDATTDAIDLDAVVDVITVDVKNGCVDNNACTSQEFCDKGTANCNGVGKCTPIPQFCPQIVNPVCGCDKKTYNNSCYANKGLTSVAYTGSCE